MRYCPNIWRYQIEKGGVDYNEAAHKRLEGPSRMKRSDILRYRLTFGCTKHNEAVSLILRYSPKIWRYNV